MKWGEQRITKLELITVEALKVAYPNWATVLWEKIADDAQGLISVNTEHIEAGLHGSIHETSTELFLAAKHFQARQEPALAASQHFPAFQNTTLDSYTFPCDQIGQIEDFQHDNVVDLILD